MLIAIPLTVIPLILYNILGFTLGDDAWGKVIFSVPLVSDWWPVTLGDLMVLLGLGFLFFETLRSVRPNRSATITNHALSTVVLIIYIIEFVVAPVAASSTFFILTLFALFDVLAGFTISIRAASRDISLGQNVDGTA